MIVSTLLFPTTCTIRPRCLNPLGRTSLAWPEFTAAFAEANHPHLTACIPVYADNAPEHDHVVQSRGAFDQTIQGLYQLARYEQPIEIRVVLHKLTVPRLRGLAEFIYRNLPF